MSPCWCLHITIMSFVALSFSQNDFMKCIPKHPKVVLPPFGGGEQQGVVLFCFIFCLFKVLHNQGQVIHPLSQDSFPKNEKRADNFKAVYVLKSFKVNSICIPTIAGCVSKMIVWWRLSGCRKVILFTYLKHNDKWGFFFLLHFFVRTHQSLQWICKACGFINIKVNDL